MTWNKFSAEIKATRASRCLCRTLTELGLRCIIISGHSGEAEALASAAVKRGVPPKILRLEITAANTLENVLYSEALIRTACLDGQLHVLAKLYAAPRSLLTLRKRFPHWKFGLHSVDWFGVKRESWSHNGKRPATAS